MAEPKVKAAIVYTIAKLTQWPVAQQPTDAVSLCASAPADLNAAFVALDGMNVQGRPLRVRTVGLRDDLSGCHIVFTSAHPPRPLSGRLTIGDASGFATAGGMIGLVTVNARVNFEINLGAASEAGFTFGPRLLSVARVINEPGR